MYQYSPLPTRFLSDMCIPNPHNVVRIVVYVAGAKSTKCARCNVERRNPYVCPIIADTLSHGLMFGEYYTPIPDTVAF